VKKQSTILVLATALAASLLFGQASGNAPNPANRVQHRVNFLTTLLNLTTAQQQQATSIFTGAASADKTMFGSMRAARQSLNTAVKNNDMAGIDQASTTVGNLTAQLTSAQAKADAAFYLILTPDQQAKLTQFESQEHGGFGRGMGPGGFRH
jgi:Spy/CpxP family protein refolding chaperone